MSRPKARNSDPARRTRPGLRVKIFVRDDMIGGGKIDLLRHLGEAGSITGAAEAMGVSYRRAWFLLDTLQRCFDAPLYVTSRGGAQSGGARLTPLGRELITRFDAQEAAIRAESAEFLDWLEANQNETAPEEG